MSDLNVGNAAADEVDLDAALERYLELTAIPGGSGNESDVAERIKAMLLQAGLDSNCIQHDDAHTKTRLRGNCGNLIITLDGDDSLPRTMLSAHMDTVDVCLGAQPEVRDDPELGRVVVATGDTGLGADDRAGCGVLVTAILERLRRQASDTSLVLAPAVVTFLIQEEIGLEGARHLDTSLVGRVDRAFNFDGGTMDMIRHGAVGGERMQVVIHGHASHAGVAPEKGVSAIVIASRAIARLDQAGLLGRIEVDGRRGTANVGVIQGGAATNVVTPEVTLKIEARSHDAEFRAWIVSQIREAFETEARLVADQLGRCGRVDFTSRVDYEAFVLSEDHPSVESARKILSELAYQPVCKVADGGLDANWLACHGIEAVTLGCGQAAIHTVDEHLLVQHYLDACRMACRLVLEV